MKKRVLLLVLMVLLSSGIAYSADSTAPSQTSGAGNYGFFVNLGYDGSYLESKYYLRNGAYNGKLNGWLNGIDVEARYETIELWTRGRFEYSGSSDVKLTSPSGAISYPGNENFYRYELALGYKVLNLGSSTLTPYVGYGHRRNNNDNGSSAVRQFFYRWDYVPVGLNYVYSFKGWSLGADAALQVPFSISAHAIDTTGSKGSADVRSGIGVKAEVPITVDIYKPKATDRLKVLGLFIPYYQYWRQEASDTINTNITHGYLTKVRTNVFGFKIGAGLNF